MCLERYQRPCCVLLGITAITLGFLEMSYHCYKLVTKEYNNWLIASMVVWSLLLIAAILLIVGSLKKIPRLLLIWVIVGLVCGIALTIIKVRLMIFYHGHSRYAVDILRATYSIFFLLLVFIWSYYPYAYLRELQKIQQ
ncbi:uncharacterized protein LOC108049438 [Drosophila rhopaloa]|uniref:Uncharacterized protein LOC108049438 n=1 Tax=Drosophila rhopaloa TaxID=1041015 RepID=A0A6P4FFG6_DRORH|nr:uncharacterized protein LOC108049438 [Drosophila rhopaloa]